MKFRQYIIYETERSSCRGGLCCDTLCCILNCSLELLCLLLILGTFFLPKFSVDAFASAAGTLGVCNIQNPTYDERNDNDKPYPSEYNRVYFGWVPKTTTGIAKNAGDTNVDPYVNGTLDMHNTPLYWRVLNTKANDVNKTPALFMLTEYCLANNIA